MKKRKITFYKILILIIILLSVSITSFSVYTPGDFTPDADSVKDDEMINIGGKIVGIIRIIGTIISVGMLIIIGIKYAVGSVEEKASYKKTLLPYIIGAILIFGAVNLTQIIYNFIDEMKPQQIETPWYQ